MDSKKLKIIFKGWKNVIVENPVAEETAKARAKICADCPFAVQSKLRMFVKEQLTEVDGMKCSQCGCPLIAKLRSEDTCPKNKW